MKVFILFINFSCFEINFHFYKIFIVFSAINNYIYKLFKNTINVSILFSYVYRIKYNF